MPGCRDDLLPEERQVFAHGTVALYAERLIMFAGIYPSVAAGGTCTAVGVRVDGYTHAWLESGGYVRTDSFDYGSDFMSGNDREFYHRVTSQECVQVGTAESDKLDFQKNFTALCFRFRYIDHLQVEGAGICIAFIYIIYY